VCAREHEHFCPIPPHRTPQRTMMKVQWLFPERERMRVRKWVKFRVCKWGSGLFTEKIELHFTIDVCLDRFWPNTGCSCYCKYTHTAFFRVLPPHIGLFKHWNVCVSMLLAMTRFFWH
jgi:hypothetical protein